MLSYFCINWEANWIFNRLKLVFGVSKQLRYSRTVSAGDSSSNPCLMRRLASASNSFTSASSPLVKKSSNSLFRLLAQSITIKFDIHFRYIMLIVIGRKVSNFTLELTTSSDYFITPRSFNCTKCLKKHKGIYINSQLCDAFTQFLCRCSS